MTDTENVPVRYGVREKEIARLTTPLVIKHGKAYDSDNLEVKCIETFSEFKHYLEPKPGILTEDEILKYARHSKSAAAIRLQRGIGDFHDKYMLNQSLPWFLGFYYVVLICMSIPIMYYAAHLAFILLVIGIVPLLYTFYVFNLKRYSFHSQVGKISDSKPKSLSNTSYNVVSEVKTIASLKKYEVKINDLKVVFDVKEKAVRGLIEKRFEPPQITYDRFISSIDSCHKVFYTNADAALNIIHLAADDTPRVEKELENKIESLEAIIDQIEDLTNELVINISSDKNSNDDLKNVLNTMEDLVESVKEY